MTTTLEDKLERAEALLTRLHSRLYRTVNAIRKVDAQRKRLVDRIHQEPPGTRAAKVAPEKIVAGALPTVAEILPAPKPFDDPLDIPIGLRRATANAADEAAKAQILADQRADKKKKAAARKAKQNDGLAKMPLTGKAAVAAIRG